MKKTSLFASFCILLFSCQNFNYQEKGKDVPTAGTLRMGVDRGDSFLITEELDLFVRDYPNAKIKPVYLCEVELIRQLQLDSLRFVTMNRELSKAEKENLEKRDIKVRSEKIAETSIAIIVNKNHQLDSLSQSRLTDILTGKLIHWSTGEAISVAFDGTCGSNYEYFSKVFLKDKIKAKGSTSFTDAHKVIEYVSTHPNALGFVSLNWISDRTESLSRELANTIKILKIENLKDKKYYLPFQSQIKAKEYPFVQQIYMHDLQGYNGLAKGFISFVASQPGQIIVKKSGLIPAHDFGRTIVIDAE